MPAGTRKQRPTARTRRKALLLLLRWTVVHLSVVLHLPVALFLRAHLGPHRFGGYAKRPAKLRRRRKAPVTKEEDQDEIAQRAKHARSEAAGQRRAYTHLTSPHRKTKHKTTSKTQRRAPPEGSRRGCSRGVSVHAQRGTRRSCEHKHCGGSCVSMQRTCLRTYAR